MTTASQEIAAPDFQFSSAIKSETAPLVSLAIPIIAGSLSFMLFGIINSYFLGPYGQVPLAAVSLTTSVAIILYASLFGLIAPIGYLLGTAYGADDAAKISSIIKHGALVSFCAGLLGFALMALSLLALPYMGQPKAVLEVITPYWLLTGASMVPFFLTMIYKQFYDCTDRAWTGTALSFASVIVNIPLTWVLVTGQFGLPELGLVGAGIASVISGIVGMIVVVAHFYLTPAYRAYRVPSAWSREAILEQFRAGIPMSVQYFFEGGAITVMGVFIGFLGEAALAANQIVFSMMGILYILPIGMSAAVGIRVSQAAGAGQQARARAIGVTGMAIAAFWSLLFTVGLVFGGKFLAQLFVNDPKVIAIAALMFVVWGLAQVFDGIQSVAVGLLRGLFDNNYPTVVSMIAYWLISLPVAYAFGFWFGFEGPGILAGYGVGLLLASILLIRRVWFITSPAQLAARVQTEAA